MEVAAYRLLYDNIHDLKTTARRVEADVHLHGIKDNRSDPVPGMQGRAHHDMWVSMLMKSVSHFNLGIALESMPKLLLYLDRVVLPRHPVLAKLHDLLPKKYQDPTRGHASGLPKRGARRVQAGGFFPQCGLAGRGCARRTEPRHLDHQGFLRVLRRGRHPLAERFS